MPAEIESMRDAFESWATKNDMTTDRIGAGYVNSLTHSTWIGWQAAWSRAPSAEAKDAMRTAGAMLANCAYNLAQRTHLTADERRSLDESRRAWDAAIAQQEASRG